jgi:hypothetical protein
LSEIFANFQEKSEDKKISEFVGKCFGTQIFLYKTKPWPWSYQPKLSDLRNFQKKSENFKPTIFVRNVRQII